MRKGGENCRDHPVTTHRTRRKEAYGTEKGKAQRQKVAGINF